MSSKFDLCVQLSESDLYKRCVMVMDALAVYGVWYVALPIWCSIFLTSLLIGHAYFTLFRSSLNRVTIRHQKHLWSIQTAGEQHEFATMRVVYDLGFVMQLAFRNGRKKYRCVIFRDQLTDEVYRLFYLHQYVSV